MKPLTKHITESLRIRIDDSPEMLQPKSWFELRRIILDRYNEQGPGTKNNPIDFNDVDVSKMTTFNDESNNTGLFEGPAFEYIDISDWDVSNIEDMSYMFWDCTHLKSVGDLSNWDVSNVRNMSNMFYKCEQLEYVGDLFNNWDVSNVRNVARMFGGSRIINRPKWH